MRPLRYSINVTLDECCDHRAISPDEDLHRHAVKHRAQADALLFGRMTYEMMEAAWRAPARKYEDTVLDILLENLDRLWRGEVSLWNEIV